MKHLFLSKSLYPLWLEAEFSFGETQSLSYFPFHTPMTISCPNSGRDHDIWIHHERCPPPTKHYSLLRPCGLAYMCFLLFFFLYHFLRIASPLVRCWLREMSIISCVLIFEFKEKRRRTHASLVSFCRSACRLFVCSFLLQTLSCFCSFCHGGVFWDYQV